MVVTYGLMLAVIDNNKTIRYIFVHIEKKSAVVMTTVAEHASRKLNCCVRYVSQRYIQRY